MVAPIAFIRPSLSVHPCAWCCLQRPHLMTAYQPCRHYKLFFLIDCLPPACLLVFIISMGLCPSSDHKDGLDSNKQCIPTKPTPTCNCVDRYHHRHEIRRLQHPPRKRSWGNRIGSGRGSRRWQSLRRRGRAKSCTEGKSHRPRAPSFVTGGCESLLYWMMAMSTQC